MEGYHNSPTAPTSGAESEVDHAAFERQLQVNLRRVKVKCYLGSTVFVFSAAALLGRFVHHGNPVLFGTAGAVKIVADFILFELINRAGKRFGWDKSNSGG